MSDENNSAAAPELSTPEAPADISRQQVASPLVGADGQPIAIA